MNQLLMAFVFVCMFASGYLIGFYEQHPVDDEPLYALTVIDCVKGRCDSYIMDKDFTKEDCDGEKPTYQNQLPHARLECVALSVE